MSSRQLRAVVEGRRVHARLADFTLTSGAAAAQQPGHAADLVLDSRGLVFEGECAAIADLHLLYRQAWHARLPSEGPLDAPVG